MGARQNPRRVPPPRMLEPGSGASQYSFLSPKTVLLRTGKEIVFAYFFKEEVRNWMPPPPLGTSSGQFHLSKLPKVISKKATPHRHPFFAGVSTGSNFDFYCSENSFSYTYKFTTLQLPRGYHTPLFNFSPVTIPVKGKTAVIEPSFFFQLCIIPLPKLIC